MYHPLPLNWIAGEDSSFRTLPPQAVHSSSGGSENLRITSKRWPHASHSYSYSGMDLILLDEGQPVVRPEQQLAVQAERDCAVAEQRVVKRTQ